jgi:hypothetical protein
LNTVATNVTVSDISVVPTGTTPSGAIQLLEDGQVILDLYEDENIPLTLSVDDFKNVAEKYSLILRLLIYLQLKEIIKSLKTFLS